MWQDTLNKVYNIFLWILFAILLGLYFSISYCNLSITINRYVFLCGFIVLCLIYLFFYRGNNLLCFETIFFILYILCVFFKELIVDNLPDNSVVSRIFYIPFSPIIESKSLVLQSLSLIVFLIGSIQGHQRFYVKSQIRKFKIYYDFSVIVWLLSVIVLMFLSFLYYNGTIASWFHYSSNVRNYTNEYIVYLTVLLLVLTIFEFSNLCNKKCRTFKQLLKSINKLYFFDIIFISVLLLISGNRNESLLIILPPILLYSIFIKKINNKQFVIGVLIGITLMIIVGVTRHDGVSVLSIQNSEFSLYEASRDFGSVNKNTNYLIEYTDNNNPIYFKNAIIILFSSVPFMGGIFQSVFNIDSDIRSTQITTDGMQSIQNIDSGLGTSLIGDLYYTGSIFFVLLYMYFFGWLLSYLYIKFNIRKEYNMWLLVIYLFLFSNVVYCIRAEWTMPFRYIGFSLVVMLISRIFIPKSRI